MSNGSAIPEVEPLQAKAMIDEGAWLVDVREPDEWAAGRAPEAVHIPLGELSSRVGELSGATSVVVICRSGGRSAMATAALVGQGIDAHNLVGGMQAWHAADLPVISDSGAGYVA